MFPKEERTREDGREGVRVSEANGRPCLAGRQVSSQRSGRPSFGFLLIEAMVAAGILALGVVLLFRSFFSSLDAVQSASNRMTAQIWLQGKMAAAREAFMAAGAATSADENGDFVLDGRAFSWHSSLQTLDTGLSSLTVSLSWKEAGRQRELSYVTYLNNP